MTMQMYWKSGGGLVACAILLSGCSSPQTVSVFRIPNGVQAQFKGSSAAEADAEVLRAAKEYCRKRDLETVVLDRDDSGVDDNPYTAKLTFRCEERARSKNSDDDEDDFDDDDDDD